MFSNSIIQNKRINLFISLLDANQSRFLLCNVVIKLYFIHFLATLKHRLEPKLDKNRLLRDASFLSMTMKDAYVLILLVIMMSFFLFRLELPPTVNY